MISWNHYILYDIIGSNISTDIICLWYHGYDWHVWFHGHKIIIWFHGIMKSYMIFMVWISVMISYFSRMKSLHDFTAWCLPWFYKFCIGFHALKSFLNSWNHIYDPHFHARAGPVLLRFWGGSSLLQSNDAFMQCIFSYNKILYDTLLQRVAGDCGAPATLLLSRRCRARA